MSSLPCESTQKMLSNDILLLPKKAMGEDAITLPCVEMCEKNGVRCCPYCTLWDLQPTPCTGE
jgi:hypothetical protein